MSIDKDSSGASLQLVNHSGTTIRVKLQEKWWGRELRIKQTELTPIALSGTQYIGARNVNFLFVAPGATLAWQREGVFTKEKADGWGPMGNVESVMVWREAGGFEPSGPETCNVSVGGPVLAIPPLTLV